MRVIREKTPRTVLVVARFAAVPLTLVGLVTTAPGPVAAGPGGAASGAAAPARAVPGPVGPNFDVSARPGNEAENTIAVNPADR